MAARKKPRAAPRPKVTVEGMSYSMTVTVGDRPPVSFAGTTLAELERDLRAASSELGKES